MKKKFVLTFATSALLSLGTVFVSNNQNVDAATMHVTRKAYVYNVKGHRTHSYLRKGRNIRTIRIKRIKGRTYWQIGKNRYVRYSNIKKLAKDATKYQPIAVKAPSVNLDNHPAVPDAKTLITNASQLPAKTKYSWSSKPEFKKGGKTNGTILVTYPDGSKDKAYVEYTFHATNTLQLPKNYTASGLKASDDTPTSEMIKATETGNKINSFISESENDDHEKVNMLKLTPEQKATLSQFALRLVNEARTQLGQSNWYYNPSVQKLADDVALEYQNNKKTGVAGHYVPGIARAAQRNGIDVQGMNQLEDLYAETSEKPKTMTDLKELTYNSICCFLFNKDEFHHAADLMSCHNDEEWNNDLQDVPFAISFSRVNGWNTTHFIRIPKNL